MNILDLIKQCGETAKSKGFWDSHKLRAEEIVEKHLFGKKYEDMTDLEEGSFHYELPCGTSLYAAEMSQIADEVIRELGEELLLGDPTIYMALMITEIAEAIEAYRKGNFTGKDGVAEELADTSIRLFDFIARFAKKLGFTPEEWVKILTDKMEYNKGRPPLHGKGF
jgi:NTP pyrophosphatase (non-canonical NTP hydrolase)